MIQRLIDFYKRSSKTGGVSDVWNGILRDYVGHLIDALERGDGSAIRDIFNDSQKAGKAMHGLDTPIMEYWGREITSGYFPALVRRIGVVPVQHPLNPSPDENWNPKNGVELKRKVEEALGPIRIPDGFLVKDNSRGIPYTYFEKLAQWFTISSLINPPPKRILEIGAGTGGLALAAYNNGVRNYTIIDIPAIAVQAAYYLSKAIGEDKVWLDGEPPNPNAVCRWFSCFAYDGARSEYDLIGNVNSFPEMTIENQDGYLRFIHECLSGNSVFYSCNHESNMPLAGTVQSSVRSAINRHGGFRAIYRAPFMIRDGYMEEFYKRK
jgi:SAM-dependent methyltransferase